MNTGTPIREKRSAMTCSVTVFPVPVAPVMRPWRLASAGSRQSSVSLFFAMGSGSGMKSLVVVGDRQFSRRRARGGSAGAARSRHSSDPPRLSVGPELLEHDVHFGVGQRRRRSDGQRAPVDLGQRFDLDRERERSGQRSADGDHSMVGEQARAPSLERGERVVGQLLRAERRVRRAPYVAASGHRDHVVEGRDAARMARERGGERRVRVHHGMHVRPGAIDVAVKAPLRRRQPRAPGGALQRHRHDVLRRGVLVGEPGRRHEKAVAAPRRRAAR